jgi:hypothetical protein
VGSSSILVKNSYLNINKKNRNDQEPGTILTGIFTEKGFINKNVSLKKITKNDEEPHIPGIGGTMATGLSSLHEKNTLQLSIQQKQTFTKKEISDIYPEYYIIKVNQFNDIAKDTLDELVYFLKNSEVKAEFGLPTQCGLNLHTME